MKSPKTRNGGQWTEARYKSFIVSTLRRTSARWGPKNDAKKIARHHERLPNANGRYVYHSRCNGCGDLVPETTSSVDHINPVIDPQVGFTSWDAFIERLFCEVEGFQVLCTPCHKAKTKGEREIATERKRRERTQP